MNEDVSPIKNGDFPASYMLVQRGSFFFGSLESVNMNGSKLEKLILILDVALMLQFSSTWLETNNDIKNVKCVLGTRFLESMNHMIYDICSILETHLF